MDIKALKLKYTNRAIMLFESIAGKVFAINTVTDNILFFYCVLLANNQDVFTLTFDQFVDELDNQPEALTNYTEWLASAVALQTQGQKKKK